MKCKLCLKEGKLCQSHILPEFFYKPIYDDPHHFEALSTEEKTKNRKHQKGIWERLFCVECEGRLSVYESYAKPIIFGGRDMRVSCEPESQLIRIHDVHYDKFKLFMLSLIWRFSIATNKDFTGVNLGQDNERLRKMILSENPGAPGDYGCMLVRPTQHEEILEGFIQTPKVSEVLGIRVCDVFAGGLGWYFWLTESYPDLVRSELILSESGVLPICLENEYFGDHIKQLAVELKRTGKI